MYKRKARILFVDRHAPAAALAARLANELGADWLEGRHATPASAAGHMPWADLLVHFDPDLPARLATPPKTLRLKHWPLAADPAQPDTALAAELRERIRGMVGGMRMLARLSPEDDD